MSDSGIKISDDDMIILKTHNLYDVKNYSGAELLNESEQKVLEIFNKYYLANEDEERSNEA